MNLAVFLSVPERAAHFPQSQGLWCLGDVTSIPAFSVAGESAIVSIQ